VEAFVDKAEYFPSSRLRAGVGAVLAAVEDTEDQLAASVVEDETLQLAHSASSQAIIASTRVERSAAANAVLSATSPSSHILMKRAATTAAHREVTRAKSTLTRLPP
jgi:hypothetical protein